MAGARAATLVSPRRIEVVDYDVPDAAPGAWLRVEACGLCGTDIAQYRGEFTTTSWAPGPVIPGHEVVGIIESGDAEILDRWGVSAGERVAVEPNIPCGSCRHCLLGRYVMCRGWFPSPMAFGFIPVSHPPSLWGGYAETMFLPPRAVVHRVPVNVGAGTASVFNALANGFEWACSLPGLAFGQSMLVLGAGQRGLAAVAAARASGAGTIIVTGLATDGRRLEAARSLGADLTLRADRVDVVSAVHDATSGELVDVVVDCTAGATAPVIDGIRCTRPGGTMVLAGLKEGRLADGFPVDTVVLGGLRLLGARSAGWESYERALSYLARVGSVFDVLRTHVLPLDQAGRALQILAGEVEGEHPLYVSLELT